ncbi:MAG: hypothetical protein PHP46_01595 [Candidatus Omnitrophica bacterium]|nr:hypothetical protein [Candidatus Omnitrophota bacterium]
MKRALFVVMVLMLCMALPAFFCAAEEVSKKAIVDAAQDALEAQGIVLADVNVVYNEANGQWEEWGMYVQRTPADPNHGLLPHGVLMNKKYQTVFFDFREDSPVKDTWVFVDCDTGEVLAIYQMK